MRKKGYSDDGKRTDLEKPDIHIERESLTVYGKPIIVYSPIMYGGCSSDGEVLKDFADRIRRQGLQSRGD